MDRRKIDEPLRRRGALVRAEGESVKITWRQNPDDPEEPTWLLAFDEDGLQRARVCGSKVYDLGSSPDLYDSHESAKRSVEKRLQEMEDKSDETPGRTSMLKEIATDTKAFIHENRNFIYWLALAFLADHFFFNGAFRQRLNALVEKMIGKVEKQLESK